VLNYSLSNPVYAAGSFLFLPVGFNLESYSILLRDEAIWRALFISISRSIIGPIAMLMVCGMAGYVLNRQDLVFGKFFRLFIFFTMYFSAGLIPTYLVIMNLGLLNTFSVYILPSIVSVFNLVLIRAFIGSLPDSIEEAALIDGANEFQVFWKVLFPLCLPINAAVLLFSAITHWNDFITTQLYNAMAPHLFTMQYFLWNAMAVQLNRSLEEAMRALATPAVTGQTLNMAMTVITVVPIAIVYPFISKYFVSGLLVGAVKA
jgi:putative aldouronate transport system permease protein